MIFYLPVPSPDLEEFAKDWNYQRQDPRRLVIVHGEQPQPLAQINYNETLFILCHGRLSTPNMIGGIVGVSKNWLGRKKNNVQFITASQLVQRLMADNLTPLISDIRLAVCFSGEGQGENVCFSGQFSSAAKKSVFKNVILTGYTGSVLITRGVNNMLLGGGRKDRRKFDATQSNKADQGIPVHGITFVGNENRSLWEILQANSSPGAGPDDPKKTHHGVGKTVWL